MAGECTLESARANPCDERPLIAHYEAIAEASRVMLDAARRGDWDQVGRQEQHCRRLIERLSAAKDDQPFRDMDHDRRLELLRAILSDDAEIRDRSEPWMRSIETMLGMRSRSSW